eukprot:1158711-Pelagomonas_calceolata.AAC.15
MARQCTAEQRIAEMLSYCIRHAVIDAVQKPFNKCAVHFCAAALYHGSGQGVDGGSARAVT